MPETITLLLAFIIALAIGVYIGKILFSAASASDKKVAEERSNSLLMQIEQLKQQANNEKLAIEKQLVQAHAERDSLRTAKDALTVQLTKKETDFDNLFERMREQRQETEE
ncbi:MAG: DNA recombination protein RmuC, partial [Flavobacterium sp.]